MAEETRRTPLRNATQSYTALEARFVEWARAEDGIRAAVVIGSRARVDHPADAWADLDLVVIARDPEPYLARTDWVAKIGRPVLSFVEPTGDGRSKERRVLFEGGLDVDFAFFPVGLIEGMLAAGIPPDAADAFRRGARVLVDKDGLAGQILAATAKLPPWSPSPPSEEEFLEAVSDFWYHAVWTAKHLPAGRTVVGQGGLRRPHEGDPAPNAGVARPGDPRPQARHLDAGAVPRRVGRSPRRGRAQGGVRPLRPERPVAGPRDDDGPLPPAGQGNRGQARPGLPLYERWGRN